MIDLRPVALVIGLMLTVLGAAMTVPALFDYAAGSRDWRGFLLAAALTVFIGCALFLSGRITAKRRTELNLRQAFLLTALSWIVVSVFAGLPFLFVEVKLSLAGAVFESVSGFTTTGSTVIVGLDTTGAGTLMWRGMLQWFGGIGIIITAIAVMPLLQVGGMQLFHTESSDRSEEKIFPRVSQIARAIGGIYLGFSLICALAYWAGGMLPFDAVVHMMATVSTGGFATSDKSFMVYDSAAIDTVAIVFMFIGALPIMLFWPALRGRPMALLGDSQVRTFAAIIVLAVAALTLFQWWNGINEGWRAFRFAAFNTVSVITGTGFMNTDYGLWGPFVTALFIYIMLLGGCSGSSACGLKIFRVQVLFLGTVNQIKRVIYPNGVFTPQYNSRPLSNAAVSSVTGYLFLFMLTFAASGLSLVASGLDMTTAFSAAATAISNCGPGMGPIVGPAGNFSTLSTVQTWVLTLTMLLGRLELLTVYVLFLPKFWRR